MTNIEKQIAKSKVTIRKFVDAYHGYKGNYESIEAPNHKKDNYTFLESFNFNSLNRNYNLKKFRSGKTDPDSMGIVHAFWKVLYGEMYYGTIERITGDTMASFHSKYGYPCDKNGNITYDEENIFGFKNNTSIVYDTDEQYSNIRLFYNMYHTIGNFIIMPLGKLVIDNPYSQTINKYRYGTLKDDFEKFLHFIKSSKIIDISKNNTPAEDKKLLLENIKEYNTNSNNHWNDDTCIRWSHLLYNNRCFFSHFDSFSQYCKEMFLFDCNNFFLFDKHIAKNNIEKSNSIINDRSSAIVSEIITKLSISVE